jgi:Fe2+ or Zn2+ uptake regulation protein
VDCAVDETPCLTASDAHGFVIDEAEVIYWGLCPDCSAVRSSEASATDSTASTPATA